MCENRLASPINQYVRSFSAPGFLAGAVFSPNENEELGGGNTKARVCLLSPFLLAKEEKAAAKSAKEGEGELGRVPFALTHALCRRSNFGAKHNACAHASVMGGNIAAH